MPCWEFLREREDNVDWVFWDSLLGPKILGIFLLDFCFTADTQQVYLRAIRVGCVAAHVKLRCGASAREEDGEVEREGYGGWCR